MPHIFLRSVESLPFPSHEPTNFGDLHVLHVARSDSVSEEEAVSVSRLFDQSIVFDVRIRGLLPVGLRLLPQLVPSVVRFFDLLWCVSRQPSFVRCNILCTIFIGCVIQALENMSVSRNPRAEKRCTYLVLCSINIPVLLSGRPCPRAIDRRAFNCTFCKYESPGGRW